MPGGILPLFRKIPTRLARHADEWTESPGSGGTEGPKKNGFGEDGTATVPGFGRNRGTEKKRVREGRDGCGP